jgi:hypothetical protein
MGDWTGDAPGVRRKITVADLPPPDGSHSASNFPTVVSRPPGAQLHVPDGFKIEQFAAGLRDPRVLRTAPNGDIFVTESRANRIKVMRVKDGDGKPATTQIFTEAQLNQPFGIAFYPQGPEPQYLYVANTDGVIRFPYHNGDLKARGSAEKLGAHLSPGASCAAAGIGLVISLFRLMEKRCMSRSAHVQMSRTTPPRRTGRASSNSTQMAMPERFTRGEFATQSVSLFVPAPTNFG